MAELFTSQMRFYGRHGHFLEALTPDREKAKDTELPEVERNKFLFDTVVDIYVIAPLIGFLYGRKSPKDGNENTKSIFEGALASHRDRLQFTYKLLMVIDQESEPDIDERLRRAFQADEESSAAGSELFDAYARGGIEILYEKLVENGGTPDALLENVADYVDEFSSQFLEEEAPIDLDSYFTHP